MPTTGSSLAAASNLSFFKNYFVTGDYAVAGVGLRGVGIGNITMSGVPAGADILAAYLYWETLGNGQNGTFRGIAISGTPLGTTASPCWPEPTITVYRADVLKFLQLDANGNFVANGAYVVSLPDSGNPSTAPSTEGASLVVVYRKPGLPYRAVVLYDGAFTMPALGSTFSVMLQGFYQASTQNPQAKLTHIVGDGQAPSPGSNNVTVNGTVINNPFTSSAGQYWDNPTYTVTLPGNASQVSTSSAMTGDCLTWGAVVFSTTVQDTDGDGLLDTWESNGFTDMDGSFVNLPAMGADPNKKDLFIEIDWMTAADHSHKPKQSAIDKIVAAFAAAPTPIALHIDVGQGGAFTGGNSIPETSPTAFKSDFLTIKNSNFSNNRRHIFHYSLWAHAQPNTTSSGVADLPGGDYMVTLGLWRHTNLADDQVGTVEEQAGTLMHELGHNLSLKHGGNDHVPNFKPNFESIMNYMFQTSGLQNTAGTIVFDYSRQALSNLDESSLNESTGLGTINYRTRWYAPTNFIDRFLGRSTELCSNPDSNGLCAASCQTPLIQKQSGVSGGINWNNDVLGILSSSVAVDINGDCSNSAYPGFNDWAALDLQQVGARPHYPSTNPTSLDITFENATKIAPPAPINLAARIRPGSVALAWNPVVLSTVNEYRVYRFESSNPENTLQFVGHSVSGPGTTPPAVFIDTSAKAGVIYTYFVTAKDEFGNESDTSNLLGVVAQ
jgi:hypothetical protein